MQPDEISLQITLWQSGNCFQITEGCWHSFAVTRIRFVIPFAVVSSGRHETEEQTDAVWPQMSATSDTQEGELRWTLSELTTSAHAVRDRVVQQHRGHLELDELVLSTSCWVPHGSQGDRNLEFPSRLLLHCMSWAQQISRLIYVAGVCNYYKL